MKKAQNRYETWLTISLVVFAVLLTYGILIPKLGFYRDDWYMILAGRGGGGNALVNLFQSDRPFIGYLYALDFSLLGEAPIGWHLIALLVRLIASLAFLWFLRLLWPKYKIETVLLTLLYVVFPGFLQQPVAATYINLLMAVAASVLSFALTAYVIRSHSRILVITLSTIATGLVIFYLAIFESMIGLEAARFIIVVYLLAQTRSLDWKSAFKQAILWDWSYLFAAGCFLFWRLFIFQSTRHSTDLSSLITGYAASPIRAVGTIAIETGKDLFETVIQSWAVPLYLYTVNGNYLDLVVSLLLAALVVAGVLLYLRFYSSEEKRSLEFPSASLWLGGIIALLALLPIDLAGRNVSFTLQWDRYTLHAALGCVMLLGGFVIKALHKKVRVGFLLALIAVGVVTQYHSAAYYRDFWNYERSLWWQMSWRAPSLKSNTLLYVQLPENFFFFEDYEIYAPANLIFTSEPKIRIAADLINARTVPLLIKGEVKGKTIRGVYVHRNYKNPLMLVIPQPNSCLHVLDGKKLELPSFDNGNLLNIASYSKIDRIELSGPETVPPMRIFGPPPERDWCFYYEKISLARQQDNWIEAARLADEAAQKGFHPRDGSEWFPIFEAYSNTGQFEKAEQIAPKILENSDARFLYCLQINNREDFPESFNYDYINSTLCSSFP